jgi:YbbR domain-containing protein
MNYIQRFVHETAVILASLGRASISSIRDNGGLAAVSVVLAFGLWILVTDSENPTQTHVLSENLPVEAVNVPPDAVVENDLVSVQVEVSVEENVYESLSASDFEATVNVEGLNLGEHTLPVEVKPLTSRGDLRVEKVRPAEIKVVLAPLVSKDVPVVLDVIGSPPDGYEVSDPETEDTTVRVAGSQGQVDLVSQAYAAVDVKARTTPVEQSVRLEAQDDHGNPVEGVTLEPGITNVSVDITQVIFQKVVVVEPVLEGTPGEGFEVTSVNARPVTVVVSGTSESIAQVQTIRTEPVNIDGEESEVVESVDLDLSGLPEGATVEGTGNVTVTVGIKKLAD